MRDALYASILEDPDDVLVRLAYADWLEENGGTAELGRAGLIRLCC